MRRKLTLSVSFLKDCLKKIQFLSQHSYIVHVLNTFLMNDLISWAEQYKAT
jgi:hypothetical protein